MNFETCIVDIRKLVKAISGKDAEVFITYRGTALGRVKPWHIKCDIKEMEHETHEGAALLLYYFLADELRKRIESTETQALNYRDAYNSITKKRDRIVESIPFGPATDGMSTDLS